LGEIFHFEVCYGLNGKLKKNVAGEEYVASLVIKKGTRWPQRMESTRAHHFLAEELYFCRDLPGPGRCLLKAFLGLSSLRPPSACAVC